MFKCNLQILERNSSITIVFASTLPSSKILPLSKYYLVLLTRKQFASPEYLGVLLKLRYLNHIIVRRVSTEKREVLPLIL